MKIKDKIFDLRTQAISDRLMFSKSKLIEFIWASVYNRIQASALWDAIRWDYKSKI